MDYKEHFGSKWLDVPYRSGMDKKLLAKYFNEHGISIEFKKFTEIDLNSQKLRIKSFFTLHQRILDIITKVL